MRDQQPNNPIFLRPATRNLMVFLFVVAAASSLFGLMQENNLPGPLTKTEYDQHLFFQSMTKQDIVSSLIMIVPLALLYRALQNMDQQHAQRNFQR